MNRVEGVTRVRMQARLMLRSQKNTLISSGFEKKIPRIHTYISCRRVAFTEICT